MDKFKPGDKVRRKFGDAIDVVVSVPGVKEYDLKGFVYAEEGFVLKNFGWEFQKDWELRSGPKQGKSKTAKFVLAYRGGCCEDTTEEFETINEIKKRIKVLHDDGEIETDSILTVYEIKKKLPVTLEDKVVIKGI